MIAMSTIVPIAIAIPGKRHDVGVHTDDMHGDERHQHGCRQADGDDETAPQMQQKEHDDHSGDENLVAQSGCQRSDRFVDQPTAVVDAVNLDTPQRRFDLRDLRLDSANDDTRIFAVLHDNDTTNRFGTVVIECSAAGNRDRVVRWRRH